MVISSFNSAVDGGIFHSLDHSRSNGVPSEGVDVRVLIVGGGPTGLLLAYLLSRLGVKSLIVERYAERLGAPKAHALSPRTLEICRQFGLDTARIRQLGTKRADAFWVNFLTDLSGETVGVLPYERMDTAVLDDTPEMIHNIPQPVFEQFVTDHLAHDPNVDVRKGISFVSLDQDSNQVTTTVEERATGHKFLIRSRHFIACDGAGSKVRNFLNIESEGEDSYETMMTIHFNANLRPIVGDRVGMLHWIMDPLAAGFIIAYDLSGNAVLISNFDSDRHPIDTWNEALCRKVVASALGKEDFPFDIHSYRPWLLSRKVANSYRDGNVFLAGDAAHSFPPTGGLGLNSGLADVQNIAYKLAAVHQGWATDTILESYQADRRHVAEVNSMQSVKNGKKIFGLLKTLGTASSDLAEARRNLFATIHDPEKKKQIDEGVEGQREHFDNLRLHIGYVYGSAEIPSNASNYVPVYVPGARLPHTWITLANPTAAHRLPEIDVSYVTEFTANEVSARKYSTLDLCAGNAFTFILGASHKTLWQERIQRICSFYQKTGCKFNTYYLDVDFGLVPNAGHGEAWAENAGINEGGGLLVRPDQHILMALKMDTDSADVLRDLKSHLGQ